MSGQTLVLLVEDDFFIGLEYSDILEQMGLEVAGPAASEEDARALLETSDITLALLDVSIEDGNSFALAEELLRRDIPFGFISAFANHADMFPEYLKHCPRLAKPAHPQQIEALIRTLLSPPA